MATPYNIDRMKANKGSSVLEDGGKGAMVTALYRHPNGQEAIVQYDPLFGNAQANAFEQVGYKFVREALPEEIKTIPELVLEKDKTAEAGLAGLTAQVAEQNKLLTQELTKQREERAQVPSDQTEISGERARQSAADQASVRSQAHGEVAVTDSGDMEKVDGLTPKQVDKVIHDDPNAGVEKVAPERVPTGSPHRDETAPEEDSSDEEVSDKPLEKQNRSELEATAAAEGLEVTPDLDTNKKLRDAIVAGREEVSEDEDSEAPADDEDLPSAPELDDEGDSEESEKE